MFYIRLKWSRPLGYFQIVSVFLLKLLMILYIPFKILTDRSVRFWVYQKGII